MLAMLTTLHGSVTKVSLFIIIIFLALQVFLSDAYSASGQKCSAQSILFVHENWTKSGVDLLGKIKALAARRKLSDLTIGPVSAKLSCRFR